jgi:hypothetical protein
MKDFSSIPPADIAYATGMFRHLSHWYGDFAICAVLKIIGKGKFAYFVLLPGGLELGLILLLNRRK